MGDQFADLFRRNAVVERALEMALELLGAVERNQCRARDEAAVALGESRPLPHVAEQYFFRQVDELGYGSAHLVAGGRWRGRFGGHEHFFL